VEIEGVIAQCGIAVIPNLWEEPFGKVALDFLTTKMVIVASFNGGIREILETDSGTIEIVESSANGIAQALESAMSNNVEVSVKKRKAVLENFSEEAIGKKWRTLIEDVVKIA
jgi:glycosyltransferase involved in cell wall biosynthesis